MCTQQPPKKVRDILAGNLLQSQILDKTMKGRVKIELMRNHDAEVVMFQNKSQDFLIEQESKKRVDSVTKPSDVNTTDNKTKSNVDNATFSQPITTTEQKS